MESLEEIKRLLVNYPDCPESQIKPLPKTSKGLDKFLKDFNKIIPFLNKGVNPKTISAELGISKATVYYWFRRLGKKYDQRVGLKYGNLTVISKSHEGDSKEESKYSVHCATCSSHPVYSKIKFKSIIERLNSGKIPCACNPYYELPTEELKKDLIYFYAKNKSFIIHEITPRHFKYTCNVCEVKDTMTLVSIRTGGNLTCRCSGNFRPKNRTQELTAVEGALNDRIDNTLEVAGYLSSEKKFLLTCSICSLDTKLYPYGSLLASRKEITRGYIPCGCSTGHTNFQYKILIQRKLEGTDLYLSNWDDESKITYKTLINIRCKDHGIFKRSVDRLLYSNKPSCTECHKIYLSAHFKSDEAYVKSSLVSKMQKRSYILKIQ